MQLYSMPTPFEMLKNLVALINRVQAAEHFSTVTTAQIPPAAPARLLASARRGVDGCWLVRLPL